MPNFDGENRSMCFGSKQNCKTETNNLDNSAFHSLGKDVKQ